MGADTESFNNELYNLLKVRGYKPVPLNSQNQRVGASQEADVIEFTFVKDGEDYGKVWISIDNANSVKIYFDDTQQDSPTTTTPGKEYDDTWTGLLKFIKVWAQRRQLSFELTNKDRLGDDMRQRDYFKMKEKLGESSMTDAENCKRKYNWCMRQRDLLMSQANRSTHSDTTNNLYVQAGDMEEKAMKYAEQYEELTGNQLNEGYYPMGKKASYNDAVPNVKIVLQHNRSLEEGEQRYRNIAKIYLENVDGERFLAPTTKPGIARVYARHIAEGGLPNDERWGHIKSICEEYNKMAGFVRATRNGQFNESALELVNEGINHYQNLRETLHKMTGHRGYQTYFESWTPSLMEDALDESINELFVQENIDPRIESAMPILSRLKKPTVEMAEVSSLAEWADDIINEKLELDEISKNLAQKYISKASKSVDDSRTQANMINYRPFGGKPDPEEWREYNKLNTAADKREKQISLARAKKNKSGETAPHYTPHAKAKIKATDNEKLELDEISKNLAQKYISKASKSVDDLRLQQGMLHYNPWDIEDFELTPDEQDEYKNSKDKEEKREKMIALARAKKNKSGETAPHYTPHAKAKIKATDSKVDEVLDTRDAKMSYAKKNMDSHQNAVSTYHKSSDPDEKKAADKTAMKRLRGMNTFVNNKVSTDDLDETSDQLKKDMGGKTHWFSTRRMAAKHIDKLDALSSGRDGPGQHLEYGENHGHPEHVIGVHAGLPNGNATYNHLMKYAKPFKPDISEGDSQYKVGDKVKWHDSKFDKNMTGTITVVSSGKRDGVKYASVKATGTHGSDFKVPHSKLKKVEEDLDANQKRAGQLGPTEKVKHNNIGKLVGANESTEIDPELARIIEMAKFKR
jgi:hypothetical protein